MSFIEVVASVLTLVSVFLTVRLNKVLYPVGIIATVLYFYIFWQSKLYASAFLQIYFTLVQIYGWWFWSYGDRGKVPQIGNWSWKVICGLGGIIAIITTIISFALFTYTDAKAPLGDTAILTLSILAQFLLDRKQIKSWVVWGIVDILSIYIYAQQGLWVTAALYATLLANVFWGWFYWRKIYAFVQAKEVKV